MIVKSSGLLVRVLWLPSRTTTPRHRITFKFGCNLIYFISFNLFYNCYSDDETMAEVVSGREFDEIHHWHSLKPISDDYERTKAEGVYNQVKTCAKPYILLIRTLLFLNNLGCVT